MLKTHNIWTYDACRITFGIRSEQIFTKLIKIHKEAIKKQLGFYSWCSKQTDKQLERGTAVDKWKTIVREEEGLQLEASCLPDSEYYCEKHNNKVRLSGSHLYVVCNIMGDLKNDGS